MAVAVPAVPLATGTTAVCPPLLYAVPPPSMERFTLPDGVAEPLAATTVMVKVSAALRAGVEFAAEIVVVVPVTGVAFAGHAVIRLARFTEPRPVTSS